jgi:pimeloyl-ACP methyl ester carboxylesterase
LVAGKRPPRLIRLFLVASSPLSPLVIGDTQREQMKADYRDRRVIEWTLQNVLLGSPISAAAKEKLIADALRLSTEAKAGWIKIGSREDFCYRAAEIDAPVVIVAGELDRVDPVNMVKEHIVSNYPSALARFLPNKGHLLPVEAPQEIANIVRSVADGAWR